MTEIIAVLKSNEIVCVKKTMDQQKRGLYTQSPSHLLASPVYKMGKVTRMEKTTHMRNLLLISPKN
jgi:hypothetical protein